MASHTILNYFLEYNDIVNVLHRFEIYTEDFNVYHQGVQVTHLGVDVTHGGGNTTVLGKEIQGKVFLDYSTTDDPLESIRGHGLRVELEANENLTFKDLYSEEQKKFGVVYYRNSIVIFNGWLNPEGWFEDYVSEKWVVSFDCIDGLGYLKDLSFVDSSGFPFTGKKTMLDVISKALERTGLTHNINVDIDIYYTGLATTVNILANTYVNTSRYVKDDGETITSCEEVLRDILEPFAACITAHNGEWFIYKPNQLFNNSTMTHYRYDYLGTPLSPATKTLDVAITIGSESLGFSPHHCSGNQSIRNLASLGAYRINYKYGQLKSLLENINLCSVGAVIADWTILSNTYLTFPINGSCNIKIDITPPGNIEPVIETNIITVAQGTKLEISQKFSFEGTTIDDSVYAYQLLLIDGADTWYLDSGNVWNQNSVFNLFFDTRMEADFNVITDPNVTPVSGDIKLIIHTGRYKVDPTTGAYTITEVLISNLTEQSLIEGEFHTVQRTTNPSAKIKDVREVLTGDNPEENYEGAIYKNDANTTTSTWFRKGKTEAFEILRIMGEETLRINSNTHRVFSGDVFGHFYYMSIVTLDGLDGLFMTIEYSYDTMDNIINAKFMQIFGAELTDIDYKLTFDYGKTVKPTIKG